MSWWKSALLLGRGSTKSHPLPHHHPSTTTTTHHSPPLHQRNNNRLLLKSNNNIKINKCRVRLLASVIVTVLFCSYFVGLILMHMLSSSNNNRTNIGAAHSIQQQQQQQQWPPLQQDTQPLCHFEGHCPVGTTCVGHPLSPWGGVCQTYRPNTRRDLMELRNVPDYIMNNNMDVTVNNNNNGDNNNKQQPKPSQRQLFDDCISKCQKELEWDEHFYYDVLVFKLYNTLRASSMIPPQRPKACLLVFERSSGRNDALKDANREDWLQARHGQHIVRVDPFIEDTNNNLTSSPEGILWTAMCYYPCQTDSDCGSHNDFFYCNTDRGGVCDRNPLYWEQSQYQQQQQQYQHLDADIQQKIQKIQGTTTNTTTSTTTTSSPMMSHTVLVTGADSGYFSGLVNFAASVRYWAPHNPLVVYNLGMTEQQLQVVESWSNVIAIEWRNGIPYSQPHVHQLKVYAWKPLAVNESVHKYRNMFWLDAGATYTGPIDGLEHYLQRTGIFLVKGQDESMYNRAHESTFSYFHLDKSTFVGGPHFAGGIQGHLFPSRYIDTIVKPNAECALIADCISPPGSNLGNHRYDQTTLSILAYGRYHKIPHHTEFLAASSSQLHPDLRQANSMFMWTARQGCSFYTHLEEDQQQSQNQPQNEPNRQLMMKMMKHQRHERHSNKLDGRGDVAFADHGNDVSLRQHYAALRAAFKQKPGHHLDRMLLNNHHNWGV